MEQNPLVLQFGIKTILEITKKKTVLKHNVLIINKCIVNLHNKNIFQMIRKILATTLESLKFLEIIEIVQKKRVSFTFSCLALTHWFNLSLIRLFKKFRLFPTKPYFCFYCAIYNNLFLFVLLCNP